MNIWAYVRKHTYSSPERHINILLKEAKKLLNDRRNLKVLDIGGGFRDRKREIESIGLVTVLDIEKGENVDVVGNAHKLPFEKNVWDVVTLFMVLEHLYDPQIAIREINRVLKGEGLLLLTTIQYWHKHDTPKDYYRFTKNGLLYILEKNGFRIKKIWSMGGPCLVVFHAIELNLPDILRKVFLLLSPVFNYLDDLFFKHEDRRIFSDSVGWSVIAEKHES